MQVSSKFEGFSKDGISFLKALKKNNKREWFQKRKEVYEAELKTPMQKFIAALGTEIGKEFPQLRFDPKKSMFRIYRDTRFSGDKKPYKTNIGASFSSTKATDMEAPGLYFHVEPGEVFVAGGLYMPSGEQIRLIRNSILENPQKYFSVIKDKAFVKKFKEIQGEKLKRAPQGMDPNHELIEFLKNKQFYVYTEIDEKLIYDPKKLVKKVAEEFRAMKPLLNWLNDATYAARAKKVFGVGAF